MIGPNVNVKFSDLKAESRETEKFSSLVYVATCRLHANHNSLKARIKLCRRIWRKFMKTMSKLLNELPALRGKYVVLSEIDIFLFTFYEHRCCENEKCTGQAVTLWMVMLKF